MIAVSVLNGAQGGSRTHKTLILSQVPMPIRLLGHIIEKPLASHRPVVDLLLVFTTYVSHFKINSFAKALSVSRGVP